jgi:hypothetical protein
MKYFTRELLKRFQSEDDDVADQADADWERALQAYEKRWKSIKQKLPDAVRRFHRVGPCLHDAEVLALRQAGPLLSLVVQLDAPPQELVFLSFLLHENPVIRGEPIGRFWLYEEFDLDRGKPRFEVLLSQESSIRLRFHDFRYWRSSHVVPSTWTEKSVELKKAQ